MDRERLKIWVRGSAMANLHSFRKPFGSSSKPDAFQTFREASRFRTSATEIMEKVNFEPGGSIGRVDGVDEGALHWAAKALFRQSALSKEEMATQPLSARGGMESRLCSRQADLATAQHCMYMYFVHLPVLVDTSKISENGLFSSTILIM